MTQSTADADRGDTLVEVLISILIVSILVIALIAGFGTSTAVSVLHKQQATAQTIARDFSEYLNYTGSGGVTYSGCTALASPDYSGAVSNFQNQYQLPDGSKPLSGATASYSLAVTSVTYISYTTGSPSTATFSPTCPLTGDPGAQRISFTVTSNQDTSVKQTMQVVVRRPL